MIDAVIPQLIADLVTAGLVLVLLRLTGYRLVLERREKSEGGA